MDFPPPSEKQARLLWTALTTFALGLLLATLAVFIWGLGRVLGLLSPVLWPLAMAGVIAYLLDPVVDYLERRKVARSPAILIVFLAGALAVSGVFASVIPQLVRETSQLVADVPGYARQIQSQVNEWMSGSRWLMKRFHSVTPKPGDTNAGPAAPATEPALQAANTNSPAVLSQLGEPGWEQQMIESTVARLTAALPAMGRWFLAELSHAASWAGFVFGLVMVPVFTFYFLQEKKGIQAGWTHYLPVKESRFKEELVFVLNAINNYLIVFFRGQVLIALCDGTLLTIGFLALGLNYAFVFGAMMSVLGIVPYLGTIITIIPATLIAAIEFRDWLHPLVVLGIFGIVHGLDGFVISPRIMGNRVGLHPLTIIIAMLVGTTLLGGILGGLLAIPFTAALRVVMFRYVWRRAAP
jgi:predicted PurR-regulated permease PerM